MSSEAKTMFDSIDVPNLDCITDDPKEMVLLASVYSAYSMYCHWKALAMRQRKRGNIGSALRTEAKADSVYLKLPGWAKW